MSIVQMMAMDLMKPQYSQHMCILPDLNNIASSDFSTEENTMQAQADNMRSNAQVEKRTPANKPECEAGDRQTILNPTTMLHNLWAKFWYSISR